MNAFVSFVILIGVLIFVHELGHFLTGKLLGVKVLTFSLGFPPKLFGKQIGETQYVIGAIPLGGYVKFLGEDAADDVSKEDLARAFHVQPIWKRLIIVLAGPLMNLIFPIFIYFVVISLQSQIVPSVVGMVVPGGPADKAGLLPDDEIVEIDGKRVRGFDDLRDVVGARPGKTVKVVFIRNGRKMETTVTASRQIENQIPALDIKREVGRIGILNQYRQPIIQVFDSDSLAYGSGLRTGDLIVNFGGKRIEKWDDLKDASLEPGAAHRVKLLRPEEVKTVVGSFYVYKPMSLSIDLSEGLDSGSSVDLEMLGVDSTELYISSVTRGSAADMIGIRPGDRVVKVNGKEIHLWDELKMALKEYPESEHEITMRRPDGSLMSARFKMMKTTIVGQLKEPIIEYVFGAANYSLYESVDLIPNPNPVGRALKGSVVETLSVVKLTFMGIVRIIQGRVSSKTLGGPMMIFDIAGKAAKRGASSFLWIMALISINLGIINLAPIPMLDGGLVVLFLFEAITRRSPGQRFRLVYQYVGLALIGLLIIFVVKNDLERYWDSIVEFFKQLL